MHKLLTRLRPHIRRPAPPIAADRLRDIPRATSPRPPRPPLQPTPAVVCDPGTPAATLWIIARDHPELRRWIAANPNADAALLEYVSQQGGPYVRESLAVLLESLG